MVSRLYWLQPPARSPVAIDRHPLLSAAVTRDGARRWLHVNVPPELAVSSMEVRACELQRRRPGRPLSMTRESLVWTAPVAETVRCVGLWLSTAAEPRAIADVEWLLQHGVVGRAVEGEPDEGPGELAVERYLGSSVPPPLTELETYCRISAEVGEGRDPRGEVLARHDYDEHQWLVEERAWLEKMAQGVRTGDLSLTERYGELFTEAQDALRGDSEAARGPVEYARIRAYLDTWPDAQRVLEHFELTLPVWFRLERAMVRRMTSEPELARLIRRDAASEVERAERDWAALQRHGEEELG